MCGSDIGLYTRDPDRTLFFLALWACLYQPQGTGEEYNRQILTYLLTPWCRVLLEKLIGLQLVKRFPAFLWNPKVHYRTHKRPPPVPVLVQPNPVYITTFHLLEIHPNIIHPSTPRSPQWSLSLRFLHQNPIRPPLLTQRDKILESSEFFSLPQCT